MPIRRSSEGMRARRSTSTSKRYVPIRPVNRPTAVSSSASERSDPDVVSCHHMAPTTIAPSATIAATNPSRPDWGTAANGSGLKSPGAGTAALRWRVDTTGNDRLGT